MDKNQSGMMPNPGQHDFLMDKNQSGMMPIPMQHDLVGHFSGDMQFSKPNPNCQQHFSTGNQANLSAPRQTDPAWFNSLALSVEVTKEYVGSGSVTSQQRSSSQSSPDMPSPDSVACHSAQTSPDFHQSAPFHTSSYCEPGFVRREVARLERRIGNPSAPQHPIPQTYNMASDGGFNPVANDNSVPAFAANWMEEATIESNEGGRKTNNAPGYFYVPTNKRRQLGNYNDDHEQRKMSRSSQLHQADFERVAQTLETPEALWQGDYNNLAYQVQAQVPGVQAQAQDSYNQVSSGPNYQFLKHNSHDDEEIEFGQHKTSCSSQIHGTNLERTAQRLEPPGDPWQGDCNNPGVQALDNQISSGADSQFFKHNLHEDQTSQKMEFGQYKTPHHRDAYELTPSQMPAQNLESVGASWQGNYKNHGYLVPEHATSKYPDNKLTFPSTAPQFSTQTSDPTLAWDVHFEAAQRDLVEQELAGRYPQNLQNSPYHVLDPWMEIKAERESFSLSVPASDSHQMSNNEGKSSSTLPSIEVAAAPTLGATRPLAPTQGLGLSEEEEAALIATRKLNRGYSRKCTDKRKGTRKHYQNELVLLPQKILRQREYRENIEKNMVFIGEALKNRHQGFLGDETRAYEDGMEELRKKFDEKKRLDSELTNAREELAKQKQKFEEAKQKSVKDKSGTVASQKSRANTEVVHLENVCNVLDLQWDLLLETKLAELATLYFQRAIPTAISKLRPILNEVRDQSYRNNEARGFENFLQFLKEHRNLFMVQRRNLPSGSTGFMRM